MFDNIKLIFEKIKNLIIRKNKNRNLLIIEQKKEKIITKILFYPICFIGVNIIYMVTYTHNLFLAVIVTASIYFLKKVLESTLISNIIILTLILIGRVFLNNSVYTKRDQFDMLEALLEIISTPEIFKKFKYAKRMARLNWKQTQYLQRKRKNHKKNIK
jgi:hypothetical protein